MKIENRESRFLFNWYHGPVITYMLFHVFKKLGWSVTFGESEFLKWELPTLTNRKPKDFRPDFEAVSSKYFFACEIKVGFSRNRKSELSLSDPHISQFLRESKFTVNRADSLGLKPIYSLALGCSIPSDLFAKLQKSSGNFIFLKITPSNYETEICNPVIDDIANTNKSDLLSLKHHFNSTSSEKWSRFAKYNRSIKKLLNATNHNSPRSAAIDIIKNVFREDPKSVKLQNLFSSLSVGRSLNSW